MLILCADIEGRGNAILDADGGFVRMCKVDPQRRIPGTRMALPIEEGDGVVLHTGTSHGAEGKPIVFTSWRPIVCPGGRSQEDQILQYASTNGPVSLKRFDFEDTEMVEALIAHGLFEIDLPTPDDSPAEAMKKITSAMREIQRMEGGVAPPQYGQRPARTDIMELFQKGSDAIEAAAKAATPRQVGTRTQPLGEAARVAAKARAADQARVTAAESAVKAAAEAENAARAEVAKAAQKAAYVEAKKAAKVAGLEPRKAHGAGLSAMNQVKREQKQD